MRVTIQPRNYLLTPSIVAWSALCWFAMLGHALYAQETIPPGSPYQDLTLPSTPYPSPSDAPSVSPSDELKGSFEAWTEEDVFAPTWYEPDYWFGPEPWDRSVELGINGSSGTSESVSIRAGGYIKRKTDWNKLDVQLIYNQTSSRRIQTQNNAQLDARHDWLLAESPWTVFAATTLFYDEYQAFDLRFAANGGLGYQFIDTDSMDLIGRFGTGTSREFGGPENRWVPEALLGGEFNAQISKRQKVYAKADYFPDWEDFTEYRMVMDVGWEIVVDEPSNMSLKVSAIDRYDSTPNGADPNSLNYSILMLWKL